MKFKIIFSCIVIILFYTFINFTFNVLSEDNFFNLFSTEFFISLPLFAFISHLLLYERWNFILKKFNLKKSRLDILYLYIAGLPLIATPAKSGEAARSIWLKKFYNFPLNSGISISIFEKLIDLFGAVFVLGLSFNYPRNIFIIFLFISSLLIFRKIFLYKGFNDLNLNLKFLYNYKFLKKFQYSSLKVKNIFFKFKDNFIFLIKGRIFIYSFLISIFVWINESFLIHYTITNLSYEISYQNAFLMRSIIGIGGALSFLPAGLFFAEITSFTIGIGYGLTRSDAIATTLVLRGVTLILPCLFGLTYIVFNRKFIKNLD